MLLFIYLAVYLFIDREKQLWSQISFRILKVLKVQDGRRKNFSKRKLALADCNLRYSRER